MINTADSFRYRTIELQSLGIMEKTALKAQKSEKTFVLIVKLLPSV